MPKSIPPSTPVLNRLRAAAALIPLVESGLSDGKLSDERAALMLAFCEWAASAQSDVPDEQHLANEIQAGLERLKNLGLPVQQAS